MFNLKYSIMSNKLTNVKYLRAENFASLVFIVNDDQFDYCKRYAKDVGIEFIEYLTH